MAVLFGLAYFACAGASVFLSAKGSIDMSFWLPGGLYVAILLLYDYTDWPWLMLAAAAGNFLFDTLYGTPLSGRLVFVGSNAISSATGAWMVRTWVAPRPTISTLKEFVGLVGLAGVLGALLAAALSAAGLAELGLAKSFQSACRIMWGSTSMATLLVTPFILSWFSRPLDFRKTLEPHKAFEAAVLFAGLIAFTWWVMVLGPGFASRNKSPFLLFLIWAGLRFGIRGATAANLVFAVFASYCVQHYLKGLTPADISSGQFVTELQIALAVSTTVGLIPAIVLAEHNKTLEDLRESETKFSKAFRSSPNGIAITHLETGRYIDVNDSFCRLWGFTKSEMLGKTSVELGVFTGPEHREGVIGPVRDTGHVKDALLHLRTRTGEPKNILFSAERIELDGEPCVVVVIFDITERMVTEERLEKTTQQLRALTSRLQTLREEERTHVAREIHDHLGQLLTALGLDLRLLERKAAAVPDAPVREGLMAKITSARILADETISAVQKIATELRPAILDRLGLEAAIEVEAQAFQSRTGMHCEWSLPSASLGLEPDDATAIFRIFQEILTNVARHSHAANVTVCLTQEAGRLTLQVDDDGVGIQPETIAGSTSLGLLGMTERAAILGGTIQFKRKAGGGTSVLVSIPQREQEGQLA
jgi:PAS domain S-box-containing protein